MTERVSNDDLAFAVDWLESYDGDGDEVEQKAFRVAAWLRRQIEQREIEAVARKHNVSRKVARKAIELAKQKAVAE